MRGPFTNTYIARPDLRRRSHVADARGGEDTSLGGVPDPRGAGLIGDQHCVTNEGQQIVVHATDGDSGAQRAHLSRDGPNGTSLLGGYTVVVKGSWDLFGGIEVEGRNAWTKAVK